MVVIHCKRLPREENSKDYDEFLFQTPNTTNIGETTDAVTKIQNLRVRIKWMVQAAAELAKDQPDEMKHILQGPADEGARYLALERCTVGKTPCTVEECEAIASHLKGAAMMVFPQHCSGADALQRLAAMLEDEATDEKRRAEVHRVLSIIDDGATTEDMLIGATAMWWSGKPLNKASDFVQYTGKNDKTKLVVKLTKDGGGAPPREPGLDAKTQAEMMAFWYRKQEEQKKLVEDEDVGYGNSEWADPTGLKKEFLGMNSIKYRPR